MQRRLLASLLILVSGAASAQSLRVGMAGDPATLDPVQSVSFVDRVALIAICDKLVDVDDKLAVVPQLATAWNWSPDGLALTMTLRADILFQDGEPVDAEAVRFNIDRAKTASYSKRKSELTPVKGVVVVDPLTVRFELSEPYAPLLPALSDRAGMLVSPKAARELGERLTNRPVCAGAFKLAEWVPQDRIVLDRFDRYWNAAAIHFDRVTYLPVPDDGVRLANLLSGGFQLTERVSPTDVAGLEGDKRVTLYQSPSVGYRLLSINLGGEGSKSPLGQDAKLREAFELALDRRTINEVAFDGRFIPSNQPEAPQTPYYDAAHPVPARDVARAKALVAASGRGRVPVTLMVSTDPLDGRVAQVIQAMVSEAGFDLRIEVIEAGTALARLKSGAFGVALVIWSGRPDPDANIALWVACDGYINYSRYCRADLDGLLKQARGETDPAVRAGLYARAASLYLADRPYVFLYHLRWFWGASARLKGLVPNPDGLVRLTGVRLER